MSDQDIKGPALAEMLGVSPRHLSNLEKAGVIKKTSYGAWALRESVRGFCQYLREQVAEKNEGGYEEDKARKMKADADLAEIQAEKEAGKLIATRLVRRRWEGAVVACRTKLLTIPDRAAPQVIVARNLDEAKKILNDEVCSALESLTEIKHDPDGTEETDAQDEA